MSPPKRDSLAICAMLGCAFGVVPDVRAGDGQRGERIVEYVNRKPKTPFIEVATGDQLTFDILKAPQRFTLRRLEAQYECEKKTGEECSGFIIETCSDKYEGFQVPDTKVEEGALFKNVVLSFRYKGEGRADEPLTMTNDKAKHWIAPLRGRLYLLPLAIQPSSLDPNNQAKQPTADELTYFKSRLPGMCSRHGGRAKNSAPRVTLTTPSLEKVVVKVKVRRVP